MTLRIRIAQAASRIESIYDRVKWRVRQASGLHPVRILPYIGHGTRTTVYIKGRVVANYRVVSARNSDSMWQNFVNMYRRFNSHEIPYASVTARFAGKDQTVTANEEGFFDFAIDLDPPLEASTQWHDVLLELPDYLDEAGASAVGQVLIPPPTSQYGIISDLDDTVLQSDVINLLKLARNTFLYNSHTRLPFAGVAEFYHALQRGTHSGFNPIFYVSNSPWNLYDLITEFFEVRGIPPGPLFLVDLGLTPKHLVRPDPTQHKLLAIERLLNVHPDLPFLLIGDSGEHDQQIYLKAIQNHPGRIAAVYIRDVTGASRHHKIKSVVEQARTAGVDMLLVRDTVAAAEHAAAHGYILPEALPAIRQERREDDAPPSI